MKKNTKLALIGVLGIFTYFFMDYIEPLFFQLADINLNNIPKIIVVIYQIIYEILIVSLLMLIFHKKLSHDFKDILVNHQKYFSNSLKYYLIGIFIMFISNSIIIFIFNSGIAGNEENVRALFKVHPIYMYISSVLLAPITEELVFRQSIRNIFGRNLYFVLASGLIFGGLHIISNINGITSILYLIPYSSLGIAFSYMLYKTDNIFVSTGFHILHNAILINYQFILLLFS